MSKTSRLRMRSLHPIAGKRCGLPRSASERCTEIRHRSPRGGPRRPFFLKKDNECQQAVACCVAAAARELPAFLRTAKPELFRPRTSSARRDETPDCGEQTIRPPSGRPLFRRIAGDKKAGFAAVKDPRPPKAAFARSHPSHSLGCCRPTAGSPAGRQPTISLSQAV